MRLLADPARLDGAGECLERCVRRQVGKIVFALAVRTVLPDQPDFLTRHVLSPHVSDALRRSVSDSYPYGGEARRKAPFGAAAPSQQPPGCIREHRFCRDRLAVRDMPL